MSSKVNFVGLKQTVPHFSGLHARDY